MARQIQRIRIEEIDWLGAFPWLRIFRSFRMSLAPSRMFLGLIFVGLVFGGANVLDRSNGPAVRSVEHIRQYATQTPDQMAQWQDQFELRTQSELYRLVTSIQVAETQISTKVKQPDRFDWASKVINEYFDRQEKLLAPLEVESDEDSDTTRKQQETDPQEPESKNSEPAKDDAAGPPSESGANAGGAESAQATEPAQANEPDEADLYAQQLAQLKLQRNQMLRQVDQMRPLGVFEAAMQFKFDALDRLILSTLSLRCGFAALSSEADPDPNTVLGALYDLCVVIPKWFLGQHTRIALLWMAYVLLIWSLLGGALSRMASLQAARDLNIGPLLALKFVTRRLAAFLGVILEPILIIGVFAAVIFVGGLLFNLPVGDLLAAVLYGLGLLLGVILTMGIILLSTGARLMHPALSIEGADSFDTISRVFNYILGRPWRWLFYNFVSLLYGAATIAFVWLVISLAVIITHRIIDLSSFTTVADASRFTVIHPRPTMGRFEYAVDWDSVTTAV